MRQFVVAFVVAILGIGRGSASALSVPQPMSPQRVVNDYAHLFSDAQRQALEAWAARIEREDTVRVAIVTADGWGECTGEAYAAAILERWPVGDSGRRNGVVVLVGAPHPGDEPGIFVEVGEEWRAGRPDPERAVERRMGEIAAIVHGGGASPASTAAAGAKRRFDRLEGGLALLSILLIGIVLRRSYRQQPGRAKIKGGVWPLLSLRRPQSFRRGQGTDHRKHAI